MTIYNLYIFDRYGTLLYYGEWNRSKQSGMSREEEGKLMYGMLFSIKSFVAKISPLDPKEGFMNYKTSKYTLHCLETPTGLKFVMNTDNQAQGVRELLKKIYGEIYVKYAVRNPMCGIGEPITSELFKNKLDAFVKQTPIHTMALTAAERSKRYREKIKQDAEKHELHKKKELKRLKKHFKKINELTEEEKNV